MEELLEQIDKEIEYNDQEKDKCRHKGDFINASICIGTSIGLVRAKQIIIETLGK